MTSSEKKPRVLLVRHWMECHERGVTTVALRLRDAGFEVIYTPYRLPEEVVAMAVAEDVDVIGMTFSTGVYEVHIPKVMKDLKEKGLGNIMVVVGGLIFDEDIDWLKQQGVAGVFGAGSNIYEFIELISKRGSSAVASR